MELFKKFGKKVSDAFSFEDEVEAASEKKEAESGTEDTDGAPRQLTDKQILAAFTDFLRKEGNVITVGEAKLVPRYFTLFLGREDYRRWTSIAVVRDTLVRFLKERLAQALTTIQGGTKPLGAGDVHIAVKADDALPVGKAEIRASIEREEGFGEIIPAGGTATPPAEEKTLVEKAATATKEEPAGEKAATVKQRSEALKSPPPKPQPRPTSKPQMETRVAVPTPEKAEPQPARPSVHVELIVEDAGSRNRYRLPNLPVVVGRYTEGGVDVADESQHLSRKHLEFSQEDDGGILVRVHENARNATTVDGTLVPPGETSPVSEGSVILVAETRITVVVTEG